MITTASNSIPVAEYSTHLVITAAAASPFCAPDSPIVVSLRLQRHNLSNLICRFQKETICLTLEAEKHREKCEQPDQKYDEDNPQDQRVCGGILDPGDGRIFRTLEVV
jgi:hypothetical protein